MSNLYQHLPTDLPDELTDVLVQGKSVRIERIVSTGHVTAHGTWYDQDEHEWVIVLTGEAELRFDSDVEPVHMRPGDHIHIPPHRKHRVDWTSSDEPTVWLAVFWNDP